MNKITEENFTFTEAALAAGITPKTLRNWLDRGQAQLDAENKREGSGWRRFSLIDIIRIAAVGKLTAFCVPVREASYLVDNVTASKLELLAQYKNTPPMAVLAALKTHTVDVWKENAVWRCDRAPEVLPTAYIVLDFGKLTEEVFERLSIEP